MQRKIIIVIVFILTFNNSYCQDSIFNNAIRFFILPIPHKIIFTSLSYERHFNTKNSIEITCKFFKYKGTEDDIYSNYDEQDIVLVPAYRHYIFSKGDTKDIFWYSFFISITYHTWDINKFSHFGGHDFVDDFLFGTGGLIGYREILGRHKKLFIDFGLGPIFYLNNNNDLPLELPKVILILGHKF